MSAPKARPGLRKVVAPPLLLRRTARFVAAVDGRWRDALEAAEVLREGDVRDEPGGERAFYGSTSLFVAARSAGGPLPDVDVAELGAILGVDPHVRVRALRVARREAEVRAAAPIGPIRAEVTVSAGARGITVLVEVVATLLDRARSARGR